MYKRLEMFGNYKNKNNDVKYYTDGNKKYAIKTFKDRELFLCTLQIPPRFHIYKSWLQCSMHFLRLPTADVRKATAAEKSGEYRRGVYLHKKRSSSGKGSAYR